MYNLKTKVQNSSQEKIDAINLAVKGRVVDYVDEYLNFGNSSNSGDAGIEAIVDTVGYELLDLSSRRIARKLK